MGTRNFMAIITRQMPPNLKELLKSIEEFYEYFKLFQYNKYDGYLEGIGFLILRFFQSLFQECGNDTTKKEKALAEFKKSFDNLNRVEDAHYIDDILSEIKAKNGKVEVEFAHPEWPFDHLYCEYGYIIDLHNMQLHILSSSDKEVLPSELLYPLTKFGSPLNTIVTYDLLNMPETEAEFIEKWNKAVDDLSNS